MIIHHIYIPKVVVRTDVVQNSTCCYENVHLPTYSPILVTCKPSIRESLFKKYN